VSFYCAECVIVAIFRKLCLIWDIKIHQKAAATLNSKCDFHNFREGEQLFPQIHCFC